MSSPWLAPISKLAEIALSHGFRSTALPADAEGARFSLVAENDGWRAEVRGRIRWRGLELHYEPLGFGSFLVEEARVAVRSGTLAVALASPVLARLGAHSRVVTDRGSFDSSELDEAEEFRTFRLETSFAPFAARHDDGEVDGEEISLRLAGFLLAVSAVSPSLVAAQIEAETEYTIEEGARSYSLTNKYERSALARELCIKMRGTRCCVCDMAFGERYGSIGDGFIHVHHLFPLAAHGGVHLVDPATDLIPVCPNCHAMLHTSTPPRTPAELRNQLRVG